MGSFINFFFKNLTGTQYREAANQAREELRASVASLAVLGASKILEKEVDAQAHKELLDKLIAEI